MHKIVLGLAVVLLVPWALWAPRVQQTTFRGWQSLELKNQFVQLNVTPQLGGRILGYRLGTHSFLWSNPGLQGQVPPPTRLGPDESWLNWGGDKLWPAPQGWENKEQWPGPPDPILDGSPQAAKVLTRGGEPPAIELTSPPDPKTGIQFRRVVRIFPGSSRVKVAASMINISARPIQWGIWTVTQLDAGDPDGNGWNRSWNVYVPFNPNSHFPRGYQVLFGPENNPEIQPHAIPGILKLQYMWTVGKVALDSSGGWLANVDGTSGYVFVQEFTYDPAAVYPDGSSVAVWTNGIGTIRAWGRTVHMQTDPSDNPYIVESELLGPRVKLMPGQQGSFTYDWYSANIGGDFPILSCSRWACICRSLAARQIGRQLSLDGRFGIFYQGRLAIEFLDTSGAPLGTRTISAAVSPLKPVVFQSTLISAPERAASIRLVLYQGRARRPGILAQAPILH